MSASRSAAITSGVAVMATGASARATVSSSLAASITGGSAALATATAAGASTPASCSRPSR
ncbi:hypothetical protein FHT03_001733 [Xanthomonas arboricola]